MPLRKDTKTSIMKIYLKKNFSLLAILLIIFFLTSVIFFHCHGNISTDCGREVMMALSILQGDILYKDILNIYAPMSYYINAVNLKLTGINLNSFYFIGSVFSLIFLSVYFLLSRQFFNKKTSFLITLFTAYACIYNSRLFNFILPYTYAATYGLTFYTISVYLLILSLKDNSLKKYYLSSLFCGAAFACKIEFFALFPLTLFVLIYFLKCKTEDIIKNIALFLIIPITFYLIPIIQGLSISDILNALQIFIKSSQVPSVGDFAKQTGTTFALKDIALWVGGIIRLIIFVIASKFLLKFSRNKTLFVFMLTIAALIHYYSKPETHFSASAILILAFAVSNIKYSLKHRKLFIIIWSAIGISVRTLFNVNTNEYGAFSFPLIFIAFIYLILLNRNKLKKYFSERVSETICFILLAGITSNIIYSISQLRMYSHSVITDRGRIDTTYEWKNAANEVLNFIKNNTRDSEKILFLPEGAMFNFLGARNTDMRMYALNQPYIETYGEDKIIKMISNSAIEYIAIIDGLGLYNFGNGRFYFHKNKITDYINKMYNIVFYDKSKDYEVLILKKKTF